MKREAEIVEQAAIQKAAQAQGASVDQVEALLEATLERFAAAASKVLGRPIEPTTEAIMALDEATLTAVDELMEREFETYLEFARKFQDGAKIETARAPNKFAADIPRPTTVAARPARPAHPMLQIASRRASTVS